MKKRMLRLLEGLAFMVSVALIIGVLLFTKQETGIPGFKLNLAAPVKTAEAVESSDQSAARAWRYAKAYARKHKLVVSETARETVLRDGKQAVGLRVWFEHQPASVVFFPDGSQQQSE